jgi:hypothetical protein
VIAASIVFGEVWWTAEELLQRWEKKVASAQEELKARINWNVGVL